MLLEISRKTLDRLAGDLGDQFEVFVDVQDGQPREFCGRGDDQVCWPGTAVGTPVGERVLDVERPRLDSRRDPFDW